MVGRQRGGGRGLSLLRRALQAREDVLRVHRPRLARVGVATGAEPPPPPLAEPRGLPPDVLRLVAVSLVMDLARTDAQARTWLARLAATSRAGRAAAHFAAHSPGATPFAAVSSLLAPVPVPPSSASAAPAVRCILHRDKRAFGANVYTLRDKRGFPLLSASRGVSPLRSTFRVWAGSAASPADRCDVGTLSSNLARTKYVLRPGRDTGALWRAFASSTNRQADDGWEYVGILSVEYEPVRRSGGGPRRMAAILFHPLTHEARMVRTKRPQYHTGMQSWCLDFHGRVTQSSVKNCQLLDDLEGSEVLLQFGRVGTDTFTCDFQPGLSPLQAFAVCLTTLEGKLW